MYMQKGLYCLSNTEDLVLVGDLRSANATSFYIALIPCSESGNSAKQCSKTQTETALYLEGSKLV